MGYDLLAATLIYDGHNALSDAIWKFYTTLNYSLLIYINFKNDTDVVESDGIKHFSINNFLFPLLSSPGKSKEALLLGAIFSPPRGSKTLIMASSA
jgi:hypothetical protein